MIGDLLVLFADIQNQRRQLRKEEPMYLPMYFFRRAATVALCVIAVSSVVGVLLLVKYLPAVAESLVRHLPVVTESLVKISESLH